MFKCLISYAVGLCGMKNMLPCDRLQVGKNCRIKMNKNTKQHAMYDIQHVHCVPGKSARII